MSKRLLPAIGIGLVLAWGSMLGQTGSQPRAFEVASVKPTTSSDNGLSNIDTTPVSLAMRNCTLWKCIWFAYRLKDYQITGGPKWLDHDRYDINARAAGPVNSPELLLMLQQLLAERFKLVIHRESRPFQGYALVVAKSGIKLKVAARDGPPMINTPRPGIITATATPLGWLARVLEGPRLLNAPVLDATQLSGVFDFKVEWAPDDVSGAAGYLGLAIAAALEDQIGLKLEPRKMPLEVIVVDSAARASEN